MKILLSPTVRETYSKLYEYSIDKNWFKFLSNTFGKSKIFLPHEYQKNIDLIILTGGNDLKLFNKDKKNLIRYHQDMKLIKKSIQDNIPLIGVCYGAQILSHFLNCKVGMIKSHIGNHSVNIKNNNETMKLGNIKKFQVNSFHNYGILKTSHKITPICTAKDDSIELFLGNKIKCLGIMWHPERFKISRTIDKKIFLNFIQKK